jgi:hypothetical protein
VPILEGKSASSLHLSRWYGSTSRRGFILWSAKPDAAELRQNASAIGVHLNINRNDTAVSDRDPGGVSSNFYP